MYWNRVKIEVDYGNPDAKSVLTHLDNRYGLRLANSLVQQRWGDYATPIRHIKKKQLTFYKNAPSDSPPDLFEVELDLSEIDKSFGNKNLTNYEWTRVYLVRVCEGKSQDSFSSGHDQCEWYLLDGESTVLHELNAKFGGVRIDDSSSAHEYLDFFCSFLSAEEGVFALICEGSHLIELEDDDVFGRDLYERRHFAVHRQYKKHETVPWAQIETEIVAKLAEIERTSRDPKPPTTPEEKFPEEKLPLRFPNMRGVILYGRHIFESEFQVTEAGTVEMVKDTPLHTDLAVRLHNVLVHKRSGLVLFTKSSKTTEVPGAVFMKHVRESEGIAYCSNIVVGGKVEFDPSEKLVGLECSNVRFLNDVIFDHCKVLSVSRFKYCRFLGAVSAVGTHFHSQLALEGCEIFALQEGRGGKQAGLGKKASQTRPGEQQGRYAIAMNLDNAWIEGSLSLEWLTIHGSLLARHLTAQSDANFSGLEVLPLVAGNGSADGQEKPKRKAAPGGGSVLLDLQRSSFAGSLNLGISVEKDVGLRKRKLMRRTRVTVCGNCRFDTMSIGKSLIIEGLAVVKPNIGVDLANYGDWGGSLSMPNVTVRGNVQSWDYDSKESARASINPPLVVDGTIDLKWSKIDGYVDLRGAHVTADLDCTGIRAAWLTLEHSPLNDVESNDHTRRETQEVVWAKYSVLSPAYRPKPVGNAPSEWIDQFAERMSVTQGNLNLGNAIIPGGVKLRGASIGGTVAVYLGAELGLISALPCCGIYTEFREMLEESGAKRQVPIKRTVLKQSASLGRLSIRDSTIAGPVSLWGAKIGHMGTQVQNAAPKPVIDIATSSLQGGLYLHAPSPREGQETTSQLLSAGQHWKDNLEDKEVHTEWTDHSGYKWIDPCGFVPEFQTFDVGQENYFWQTIQDVFHATVNGDVDILATEIGADLDLSNTHVRRRVRLNDSYVKCDVRAVICLKELDNKVTALPGSTQEVALAALQTHCSCFEFQSLRCDGDLMLTGLAVAGDVDGRNAVVRGHGEFVYKGREAAIAGDLNLCGCEVGLLKIGGQSFKDKGTINLARATVSTLEVSSLPKKINLQSIKVGNWDVEDYGSLLKATYPYDSWAYKSVENWLSAKGKDDGAKAVFKDKNWEEWELQGCSINKSIFEEAKIEKIWLALFCAIVMAGSIAVSIWPWSQFAALVAAIGLLIILLPMIFRIGSWTLHWGIKKWMWGEFMGFGTVLWKAVLLWTVLSSGLALILSDSRNVQPTFAAINAGVANIKFDDGTVNQIASKIQKARDELKNQYPDKEEWGFWNHGFWLALDITVPLVPFNLHDEWEPRESSEKTVMPQWMPPKTLANCLTLISWIIWSLIATALAGAMWVKK